MPYVEGFGTYPFGEEWLFDAVSRSHLPVLEKARDLTVSITPVLADQLEDSGVTGRLREFLIRHRIEAAEEDLRSVEDPYREAAEAELNRYGSATPSRAGRWMRFAGPRPIAGSSCLRRAPPTQSCPCSRPIAA
jgi:1,4-alpha-glucan branching enzyme